MNKIKVIGIAFFLGLVLTLNAQQKTEAGPHDFGRMWTFENPPKAWFNEAYGFEADDDWFDDVRKASLKFASWCSGSFVSPNGLIMTNHHCSRGVSLNVEMEGEDFTKDGFYAQTMADERRVEGLFVDQLLKIKDITDEVLTAIKAGNAENIIEARRAAMDGIKAKYTEMDEWKGLRLQTVVYYSGGKFSLYGYKRFNDIRLVLVPEVQIGFFGGDPDNFTYPRYALDFTFWRAYDEHGEALNTSDNYFRFNQNGVVEGEPVFICGNPARTERYRTVAQLAYDRDYRYPMILDFLNSRHEMLKEEYAKNPTKGLMNQIFGIANSVKAIGGIYKGLKNPELFGRKMEMEAILRNTSNDMSDWDELASIMAELEPHAWAYNLLGPSPLRGYSLMLMHSLNKYEQQLAANASREELGATRNEISRLAGKIGTGKDKSLLIATLNEVKRHIPSGNNALFELLDGKTIEAYVEKLMAQSKFYQEHKFDKYLEMEAEQLAGMEDGLLLASRKLIGHYTTAVGIYRNAAPLTEKLEANIANQAFKVYGESLPPDATFTLRISDGVVKGYDYNGTKAPYKTSFYGLYDRNYSNDNKHPWNLPEKWKNPTDDLLKSPIDFVSTNDIIGGNSGSPVINRNKEVVGLVFDGNIESLPGNFIFDEKSNRAVSVHAGGILAALQYIYKAKRISMELMARQ